MRVKLIIAIALLISAGLVYAQDNDQVLAEVNGTKLTYGYFIDQFPEEYRSQINKEQMTRLVENWIDTELLYQEAVKHNIHKDRQIKNMIEQQRKEIIAARYADLSLDISADFTDAEIEAYYNANKDRYVTQEMMYRLSHIVLSSKGGADAVHQRLVAGEDFSTLVQDYSEDAQSRRSNGDLGILVESGLESVVVDELRNTEVGGYSKPIRSQSGYYHIFWVMDKMPAGTHLKLKDIRIDIEESMRAEQQQTVFDDLIARLKNSASIKRNPVNAVLSE